MKIINRHTLIMIGLFLPIFVISSCQNNQRSTKDFEQYAEAIRTIFSEDEKIGAIRNHACEDTSLSETIRQYISAIDALDFSRCPADFTMAFNKHRDAWEASIPFFSPFDTLRGEMHELFAVIENMGSSPKEGLKKRIQPVTETWVEVEKVAREYGSGADIR